MNTRVLGLDLGGTKLLACAAGDRGTILAKTTRASGRDTPPARAKVLIRECLEELEDRIGPIDALGLGFPGLCDMKRGLVRSSIMLEGWREVEFARELAAEFDRPVVIDNDVNLALIGELSKRGGVEGATIFLAAGTGIGGAIAFDGNIWRGASGVAGELGNTTIDHHGAVCWCGRRGCLNTFLAHPALFVEAFAEGIANAINFLNPALIVLGGGVFAHHPELVARIRGHVARTAFPEAFAACVIEPARAGYEAGAIGAALLAAEVHRARS